MNFRLHCFGKKILYGMQVVWFNVLNLSLKKVILEKKNWKTQILQNCVYVLHVNFYLKFDSFLYISNISKEREFSKNKTTIPCNWRTFLK